MTRKDFSEVGHTGGKVTFTFECDSEGHIQYRIGYSHSSPRRPMTLVGVYAHRDGFACGNIKMGGIGQPLNTPPLPNCIAIMMASDSEGRFGHECPYCHNHFRTENIPAVHLLTCPYCGARRESYHFLTPPQKSYIQHYAEIFNDGLENIASDSSVEIVIDMDNIADAVTDEPRPDFYYSSTTQQTEYKCSVCNSYNDIRGRYAYCASCGWRNNATALFNTLENIRDRLNDGSISPQESVQQAVSEFDSAARDYVDQLVESIPMKESRRNQLQSLLFHNLDKVDDLMKTVFDINLLKGMGSDRDFVRRMFLRRHVYEHDGGVATQRYVHESHDAGIEEGMVIRETKENAHKLIGCLNRMGKSLDVDFHEIFPPEPFCIEINKDRQARKRQREEK